jgi:glycosyltransferase involved in cell wall biosynthesis
LSVTVDIIIPSRNRGPLITTAINSILSSHYQHFSLWIIDQSDDDRTRDAVAPLAQTDPRLHYLPTNTRGSNVARNIGLAASSAPYILFTDDDCRVDPYWVESMLSELKSPAVWAVFGRVLPEWEEADDDQRQTNKGVTVATKTSVERTVYHGNRFNLGFGHGANMGLTRACYRRLGGFDNLLGSGAMLSGWPERDLGYRILRRKGTIVYTPDATIFHQQWRTPQELYKTYRSYGLGTGAAVGKYVRCGDIAAAYLFGEWILDQGVRQVVSGLLKWRSREKVAVGLLQIVYPWVGLVRGLRYALDREQIMYRSSLLPPEL